MPENLYWIDNNQRQWKVLSGKNPRSSGYFALRRFVIERDGNKCTYCGKTTTLVADHIISIRNGGIHHPDNMQCLCHSCNSRKAVTIDSKPLKMQN
jgi:5-methylcytosine-specific restriction endonuclease McrA